MMTYRRSRLVLYTCLIAGVLRLTPVQAELGPPIAEQDLPNYIRNKQEAKMSDRSRHSKILKVLTDLEDTYRTKGEKSARDFAKQARLQVNDRNKVRVVIGFAETTPFRDLDRSRLMQLGADIDFVGSSVNSIDADIPMDKIRAIADKVEGVLFIRLPKRIRLKGH